MDDLNDKLYSKGVSNFTTFGMFPENGGMDRCLANP